MNWSELSFCSMPSSHQVQHEPSVQNTPAVVILFFIHPLGSDAAKFDCSNWKLNSLFHFVFSFLPFFFVFWFLFSRSVDTWTMWTVIGDRNKVNICLKLAEKFTSNVRHVEELRLELNEVLATRCVATTTTQRSATGILTQFLVSLVRISLESWNVYICMIQCAANAATFQNHGV